jgi:hypothetical protein
LEISWSIFCSKSETCSRALSYHGSHDLEDFVTVIDGRESIVADVDHAPIALRRYVIGAVQSFMAAQDFADALSGQIPPDRASQQRLPLLRRKLTAIAALR